MNRRAVLVAAGMLLVTFLVGGLTGMAVEEATGIDWFEFLDDDRDAPNSLLGDLDLTATQRERAEEILDRQEDRLEEYWNTRLPEIAGILEASYSEIRATLNEEQRTAFDKRVRELDGRVPAEALD